jgi:hypothetical protein
MTQHIEHLATHHDLRLVSLMTAGSSDTTTGKSVAPSFVTSWSLVAHRPASPGASWLLSRAGGWPATLWRYRSRELVSRLRDLITESRPDVGLFENLHLAYLCQDVPEIPWVAVEQNVETQFLASIASAQRAPLSFLYAEEARRMSHREPALLSRAGAIVALQEQEAAWMRARVPAVPTFVAPIAAREPVAERSPSAARDGFLLLGTLEWFPNREAARWLLTEVWPRVREKHPEAVLRIAGRGAVNGVLGQTPDGVEWLGEVEDAGLVLSNSRALLVPLRSGAGLRVKILEAMASGIPVITTPAGVLGIPAVSGEHLLVAEDASLFAACMLDVHDDPARAGAMARRGQEWVRAHYSWKAMTDGLEAALGAAIERGVHGKANR